MKLGWNKRLTIALLGLASVISAPMASAAIVTGNWDPKLPPEFGNFGWTATANVSVDPSCAVGQQALTVVNFFGFSFGCNSTILQPTAAFRILSAEVGIYNFSTNVIVDVLRFSPRSFGEFFIGELQLGVNGDILSLETPFDSDVQESAFLFANGSKYDFKLALPGAAPELKYRKADASWWKPFSTAIEPVTDTRFAVDTTSTEGDVIRATRLEIGQRVFGVPEPGSFALVGLALAVASLSASRRTRRAS